MSFKLQHSLKKKMVKMVYFIKLSQTVRNVVYKAFSVYLLLTVSVSFRAQRKEQLRVTVVYFSSVSEHDFRPVAFAQLLWFSSRYFLETLNFQRYHVLKINYLLCQTEMYTAVCACVPLSVCLIRNSECCNLI